MSLEQPVIARPKKVLTNREGLLAVSKQVTETVREGN